MILPELSPVSAEYQAVKPAASEFYFPAAPNLRLKVHFLVVVTVLKMNLGQMKSTSLFIIFFLSVFPPCYEMERCVCCTVEHEQADIVTLSFSI